MDVTDRINLADSGSFGNHLSTPKAVRKRRTRVSEKPNYPLNLWSIMKNCIGKELSKIPMPVNFNEPLSMLQRYIFGWINFLQKKNIFSFYFKADRRL